MPSDEETNKALESHLEDAQRKARATFFRDAAKVVVIVVAFFVLRFLFQQSHFLTPEQDMIFCWVGIFTVFFIWRGWKHYRQNDSPPKVTTDPNPPH
jgi:flagellar biosynthesis protein FlhB